MNLNKKIEDLMLAPTDDTALEIIEYILFELPDTKVEDLSWDELNRHVKIITLLEGYNVAIGNTALMQKSELLFRSVDCSRVITIVYGDISQEIKKRLAENAHRSVGERYRERFINRMIGKTKD